MSYDVAYMWNLKKLYKQIYFTKQKKPQRHKKNILMASKGERLEGRDKLGVWDEQIHTTIHKIDKQLHIYR